MAKRTKPVETPPPDPRQKIRIYQDGLHRIAEFYIEPDRKVIDVDIYLTVQAPTFEAFVNNPAERVKGDE